MAAQLHVILTQALDANAKPISGAKWKFYAAGTTTPQAVYEDADLANSLGAVVTADSAGIFPPMFYDASKTYRAVLCDEDGEPLPDRDFDPVNTSAFGGLDSTASYKGAGLVGFSQDATYNPGTAGSKLQQIVSPLDRGAAADGVTDDTGAVALTVAALDASGEILIPSGQRVRVTSFSNDLGLDVVGGGQVVIGTGTAAYQINKPYRTGAYYGRGNDYAMKNACNTPGVAWNAVIFGDSTVATTGNGGIPGGSFTPDVLLAQFFRDYGVRNFGTFTNNALGGTSWSDANPVPSLGTSTKLMVFKYSINHVSGQSVAAEMSAMRAKLAAVRADANGAWDKLTIVLVGPNSTHDTAGGRTNAWYELLRGGYEQAAWDYGCIFVDLYGIVPDSRLWAGFYSDTPSVHPSALLTQQLWAFVGDAILPRGGLQISTGSRWVSLSFSNSWTDYGSGFAPAQASLSEDGWVSLRGAIARGSGTPTAGQAMATVPNQNYYPPFSMDATATTFNGSVWSTCPLTISTAGVISPLNTAANNAFVSFNQIRWRAS